MNDERPAGRDTRLIHSAPAPDSPRLRTVGPAVQRGSTVLLPDAAALYDTRRPTYGREGLEAQVALQQALCDMEGATSASLYPNGLAAMTGALLALTAAGDDILVVDCIYGPTRRFCDRVLARYGVTTRYFNPALSPEALMALAGDRTRLIFLEAPGSLTFDMQDVPAIARLARARGVLTLIDNTWGAGLIFKPLEHGVDVSLQALTKYVGGHSDVFGGSACAKTPEIVAALEAGVHQIGWSLSPDDAYQLQRGLRTLGTRLDRHGAGALEVAAWMQGRPQVREVLFPALPGARGHEIWRRDFTGACGLFGVVLQPGPQRAVHALIDALRLFGLGFSWGGFESLAIHCDPQLDQRLNGPGLGGPLIRLHVGLEDPRDLIADLERALNAYSAAL